MARGDITLFDPPRFTPAETYESVADRVARAFGREQSVLAVYQLGNVSAPGISDLDMVVVFTDGSGSAIRPRAHMDADARYLFVHGIFGVTASRFEEALRHTLFGGVRLRWGRELRRNPEPGATEAPLAVRRQVAAEYLVSNFVARTVEATYRLASLRHLLLWGNALRYDLALLNVNTGRLHDLLEELQEWRACWFERPVRLDVIGRWFGSAVPALEAFLRELLAAYPLGTPDQAERVSYARHIHVSHSPDLGWHHRGLVCPRRLVSFDRRLFRMQHRFNRFEFRVPCVGLVPGSLLEMRSRFFDELVAEQKQMYPGLSPFTTGWHARLRRTAPARHAA